MNETTAKLETVLFVSGAPVAKNKVCKILSCSDKELEDCINELKKQRSVSGVVVVDTGTHIALTTAPSFADVVEKLQKQETHSPLSKAAQETLSIIAYLSPVSKVDLDFIRGVNTQYTLRRLAMRGLINSQKDGNAKKITVTVEFLTHLGINTLQELPDYETIRGDIEKKLSTIKKQMKESDV